MLGLHQAPSRPGLVVPAAHTAARSAAPRQMDQLATCSWREGDRCKHKRYGLGTVRYVGQMLDMGGTIFVGVELEEGRAGDEKLHDGSVFGTRYFQCAPSHGMMTKNWDTHLLQAPARGRRAAGGGPHAAAGLASRPPPAAGRTTGPVAPYAHGEADHRHPGGQRGAHRPVHAAQPEPEPEPHRGRSGGGGGGGGRRPEAAVGELGSQIDRALMGRAWAAPQSVDPASAASGFVGVAGLIEKHRQQIDELRSWAKREDWRSFDKAHFDWWTFPINEPSRHGMLYALPSRDDAELLAALPEFIQPFRKGLELVARGWGWDLAQRRWVSARTRPAKWTGRAVRLYKMGRCVHRLSFLALAGWLAGWLAHAF